MSEFFENRSVRPVRVFTEKAVFDGLLTLALGARTLDELNQSARSLLRLNSPSVISGDWRLAAGTLAISKSSILFAMEIPDLGAPLGKNTDEPEMHHFARSVLRLRVTSFELQGFVYTIRVADPLMRLSYTTPYSFLALSAASLLGHDIDCAVPFVAVNRPHIQVAQEVLSIEEGPDEVTAVAG